MYIGKIEKSEAISFDGDIKLHKMLSYSVMWKSEVDGKETFAASVGRIEQSASAKLQAAMQKKLDDYVRRYAHYAESRGVRFEVQEREKREKKERIRRAAYKATQALLEAGLKRFRAGEQVDGLVLGQELRKLPQAELEAAAANLLIEVSRRAEAAARRS